MVRKETLRAVKDRLHGLTSKQRLVYFIWALMVLVGPKANDLNDHPFLHRVTETFDISGNNTCCVV
jgi:hypothetical protein